MFSDYFISSPRPPASGSELHKKWTAEYFLQHFLFLLNNTMEQQKYKCMVAWTMEIFFTFQKTGLLTNNTVLFSFQTEENMKCIVEQCWRNKNVVQVVGQSLWIFGKDFLDVCVHPFGRLLPIQCNSRTPVLHPLCYSRAPVQYYSTIQYSTILLRYSRVQYSK